MCVLVCLTVLGGCLYDNLRVCVNANLIVYLIVCACVCGCLSVRLCVYVGVCLCCLFM